MIKHLFSLLCLLALALNLNAADNPEQLRNLLPKAVGDGEVSVLYLHGGRPWTGQAAADVMAKAGAKVTILDSVYLDGKGGASIKTFLTDLTEPKANDGITPAFELLSDYRLVIISAIPEAFQKEIFTQERIDALKDYVRSGGALILNQNAPASLGELLPAAPGAMQPVKNGLMVKRLDKTPAFSCIPEEWPVLGPYRLMTLNENARVLHAIMDENGETVAPYLAALPYGKGQVFLLNGDNARVAGMKQFLSWAYGNAYMVCMARQCANLDLNAESAIYKLSQPPKHKLHEKLSLNLDLPQDNFRDSGIAMNVQESTITLNNGITIAVDAKGAITATWNGQSRPFVANLAAPVLGFSGAQQDADKKSSEFSEKITILKKQSKDWTFQGITQKDDDTAVLRYREAGGTMLSIEIRGMEMTVDGRSYTAFGQKFHVDSSPDKVERISWSYRTPVTAGSKTYARRMSCYSPPRGYAEFDCSGAVASDTWSWSFFGSGQCFTYLSMPEGILAGFPDSAFNTEARQTIAKGGTELLTTHGMIVGFRSAPVETPFFWYAFSSVPESKDNNDWMAMTQFQRFRLRAKHGFQTIPPVPTMTWQNTCSEAEKKASIETGKKLGFKRVVMPLCPSPIANIDNAQNKAMYKLIRENGMLPFPWTAGDYSAGDSEWTFINHKEWYVHGTDGEIYKYMGAHPVYDLNHPEFQKWYLDKMASAYDNGNGLGAVYLDMYGAAQSNINYANPEALPAMDGAIKLLHFFIDNDIYAGVEGMNPLVTDNWWYRKDKYSSFQGKEFSFLSSAPSASLNGDDLDLDYFRTSMYGSFTYIHVDGFAGKFERTPTELAKVKRIGELNPAINAAMDNVGPVVHIRETPFGTSWISEKGGALFFYDGVKSLDLSLPDGWRIDGVAGNTLENISPETIVLLKK